MLQIPDTDARLAITLLAVQPLIHATSGVVQRGDQLFGAQFLLRNIGHAALTETPYLSAYVVDAGGVTRETSSAETLDVEPELESRLPLAPGAHVVGWLPFDVPRGARVSRIVWNAEGGVGDVGTWDV